jgi:hypothetical protein
MQLRIEIPLGSRLQSDEQIRSRGEPQTDGPSCRLVTCRLDELQPHPSYVRHRLSVSSSQLSALIARDDLAFREPIVITRDLKVIDGYARLELARQQGRDTILCIEHELSEEESLRWLIQTHLPCRGLNAYGRTLLALDLEQSLKDKARANQQSGGRNKGSSNLTEAKSLDVRSAIAACAHVSTGNVTKVKQLWGTAHADVKQAVRTGEISIHKAWQWSHESPKKQLENLRLRGLERGIRKKARALVADHRAKFLPTAPQTPSFTATELINLASRLSTMSTDESTAFGTVDIATLDVPGKGMYLTQELVQALKPARRDS